MNDNDTVLAFQPRKRDYPHFVAEDFDELQEKDGDDIGAEQCDRCGSFGPDGEPVGYTIDAKRGVVRCDGFMGDTPCGAEYPIQTRLADEVVVN